MVVILLSTSLLSGSFCGTILLHDLVPQKEEPYTCPAVCRIRPAPGKAASISRIQWYPHDTGIFTTSGSDQMLKIWDTNALSVVERFKFKHIVHMHAVAKAKAHSLVAGKWAWLYLGVGVVISGCGCTYIFFVINLSLFVVPF